MTVLDRDGATAAALAEEIGGRSVTCDVRAGGAVTTAVQGAAKAGVLLRALRGASMGRWNLKARP